MDSKRSSEKWERLFSGTRTFGKAGQSVISTGSARMGGRRALQLLAVFCLALLLPVGMAYAQATHGLISGTVVDPTGAAIPGVKVTVRNQLTTVSQTTQTNASGYFVFPEILPGTYNVSAQKEGFQTLTVNGIHILPAGTRDLGTLQLKLGSTKSVVTVAGTANPVQTTSSAQSSLITSRELLALPDMGRDYMALMVTLPGSSQLGWGAENLSSVTATPRFEGVSSQMGVFVTTNGVISSTSNYSYDNAPNTLDNIQSVQVLESNFTPEYGVQPGAAINVTTKSGTTAFHGSAYYYNRNEAFNANDFFYNRESIPVPRYRYNTAGGTIGGPIWGPGPLKSLKHKLFFFFSYDNEPSTTPGEGEWTMPTALERNGDFSQSLIPGTNTLYTVLNPLTGQPYTGNTIPQSQINPMMSKTLNEIYPLPNFTNRAVSLGEYNYLDNESTSSPTNQESIRVDYDPTPKWSFFGRYMRIDADNIGRTGGYSVFAGWQNASEENIALTDRYEFNVTTTLTPHLVNVFSIGHNAGLGTSYNPTAFLAEFEMPALGVSLPQTYPASNPANLLPSMSFNIANAPNWSYNSRWPNRNYQYDYSIADDLSYSLGAHLLKFGLFADLESFQIPDDDALGCYAGCLSFGSPNTSSPVNAGNPWAEALLGYFDTYTSSTSIHDFQGDTRTFDWYAQDDWRVTKKLTLNYGVRFYYDWPPVTAIDGAMLYLNDYKASEAPPLFTPVLVNGTQMAENPLTGAVGPAAYIGSFVPGVGNDAPGSVQAGASGWHGIINGKGVLPAPRFGFAYDPHGNGKTVIRGGIGLFYGQTDFSGDLYGVHGNAPNIYHPTEYYGSLSTLSSGLGLLSPSSMYYLDPNAGLPYTWQWSLNVQREVSSLKSVLSVAYVANVQRNNPYEINIDEVPYGAEFLPQNQFLGTPLPTEFYDPYPGYSSISDENWGDSGNYNSLQVTFNRKFGQRLSYGISYTWSKTMNDNRSTTYLPSSVTYGPTGFSMPNRLTADWVYNLPKASQHWNNFFSRGVLDNWEVSGIASFISGEPESVDLGTTNGENMTGGGDANQVIVTGNAVLPKSQRTFDRYFNTSVFALPSVYAPGDPLTAKYLGTGWTREFYGPGVNDWDLSFMKNIPITERVTGQLRLDMFNAFNHPSFNGVDTSADFNPATGQQVNTGMGQITSDMGPRVMQLSVRFSF